MQINNQWPSGFEQASTPPGTPPVIAEAGDIDEPGKTPPEVQPGIGGDNDNPGHGAPEQQPGQGDTDQPGETPAEFPGQPGMPGESPPPD